MNGEYFCVHGGISTKLETLDQVNQIERFQEPGDDECLFNDLLWADPMKRKFCRMYEEFRNRERGISVNFSLRVLEGFLERNQLKALIRAHEQKYCGHKFHLWRGEDKDPPCITIFSAPNYCQHRNLGAVLVFKNQGEKAQVLTYSQHQHNYFMRLQDWEDPDFDSDRPRYSDDPSIITVSYQ